MDRQKTKLKSEITEIPQEKMGMKVLGEGMVIEVKTPGFKAICPQISVKNHPRKPRSCRAFVRLLSAV